MSQKMAVVVMRMMKSVLMAAAAVKELSVVTAG